MFILIAQVSPPPKTVAGTIRQLVLTLLQRFDVAAGEGDADAVDGDLGLNRCLAGVLESLHEWGKKKNNQKHNINTKTPFRFHCHELEPNLVTVVSCSLC